MGHRDLSFDIQAPPDRVHALLVDPDRSPDWMLGLKSVATTGPLDRPGSRATLRFGGPWTVRARVLAAESGGPIGRRFDGRVGDEMTEHATKEYSRLKWIAEAAA